MVEKGSGAKKLDDLAGAAICLHEADPAAEALVGYFAKKGKSFIAMPFQEDVEWRDAYNARHCRAAASETTDLIALRGEKGVNGFDSVLLPEKLAVFPIVAATPTGDPLWAAAVARVLAFLHVGQPRAIDRDATALGLQNNWRADVGRRSAITARFSSAISAKNRLKGFRAVWSRRPWRMKTKAGWCGRRNSNPYSQREADFRTTSAFAAAFRRSWSGLSLHHGLSSRRRRPSSLYTFPERGLGSGLAWDVSPLAFPDFERFYAADFPAGTPKKSAASTDFATSAFAAESGLQALHLYRAGRARNGGVRPVHGWVAGQGMDRALRSARIHRAAFATGTRRASSAKPALWRSSPAR